ncbi:group II intron maturase-specific domain-containing protein [Paenibacillus eucommiae]|uniref:group II intron maturase-specific domain-containing protein n=1 Tax=Paenibacillus eucommiae TaxID=1355755 RepID=UPI001AE7521A|nr:group II intron maturase-specific domain-containing protein [Paenibacillus eucommiae]
MECVKPLEVQRGMVEELNPKIQGWRNYYAMDAFADLFLNKIDWYIRKRLTLF